MLTEELKQRLIAEALTARKASYSPYSHFAVGAAVLAEDGHIYGGTNIENAAYPSSLCAERVAIFKAISEGNRHIQAIAVATHAGGSPCGACRQVMREFGEQDMPVLLADAEGNLVEETSLATLLPRSFGPEDLLV